MAYGIIGDGTGGIACATVFLDSGAGTTDSVTLTFPGTLIYAVTQPITTPTLNYDITLTGAGGVSETLVSNGAAAIVPVPFEPSSPVAINTVTVALAQAGNNETFQVNLYTTVSSPLGKRSDI